MVVKDANRITDQFIDHFTEVVNKVLDESPIITKKWRKMIKIFPVSNSLHFVSTITRGCTKKEFDKKFLIEQHKDYNTRWEHKPYLTNVEYYIDEEGIMHIDGIFILIKYNVVAQQILDNLDRLDVVKQIYEVDAHHEAGHVMDFISLIDGVKFEDYYKNTGKPDDDATDEYYKWREETVKAFFDRHEDVDTETMRLITEKYYKLPAEERADILGGVDRQKFINLVYDNMKPTVDINIEVIN